MDRTTYTRTFAVLVVFGVALLSSSIGLAQQNGTLPVQGFLTDTSDVPVEGSVPVAFTLYADESGTMTELWSTTRTVAVDSGLFSVLLGAETDLDLSIFSDHSRVMLGIAVDGDSELPLIELGAAPYAGWAAFAANAGDATTVGGLDVDTLTADQDTLGDLQCNTGDAAVFDGSAWTCQGALSAADVSAVATSGEFGDLSNIPTGIADGDDDTLAGINCMAGQVIKQGMLGWACADDIDTTTTYSATAPIVITGTSIGLAASGIDTGFIADGAVTNAKLAAGIDPAKVAGTAATLSGTQNFDANTLVIDASTNRVGVGTASPSEALSVAGSVTSTGSVEAAAFAYPTPVARSLSIPGVAFEVPENEDDIMRRSSFGGYAYSDSSPDTIFISDMYAPVHLPDGARITELRCDFYDNDGTDDLSTSTARLRYRPHDSVSTFIIASLGMSTTGAVADIQSISDTTILSSAEIVDNGNNTYWIQASWSIPQPAVGSVNIRFYGCTIDYEIDGPG
jgi:hypothetical protein